MVARCKSLVGGWSHVNKIHNRVQLSEIARAKRSQEAERYRYECLMYNAGNKGFEMMTYLLPANDNVNE